MKPQSSILPLPSEGAGSSSVAREARIMCYVLHWMLCTGCLICFSEFFKEGASTPILQIRRLRQSTVIKTPTIQVHECQAVRLSILDIMVLPNHHSAPRSVGPRLHFGSQPKSFSFHDPSLTSSVGAQLPSSLGIPVSLSSLRYMKWTLSQIVSSPCPFNVSDQIPRTLLCPFPAAPPLLVPSLSPPFSPRYPLQPHPSSIVPMPTGPSHSQPLPLPLG